MSEVARKHWALNPDKNGIAHGLLKEFYSSIDTEIKGQSILYFVRVRGGQCTVRVT